MCSFSPRNRSKPALPRERLPPTCGPPANRFSTSPGYHEHSINPSYTRQVVCSSAARSSSAAERPKSKTVAALAMKGYSDLRFAKCRATMDTLRVPWLQGLRGRHRIVDNMLRWLSDVVWLNCCKLSLQLERNGKSNGLNDLT